MIVTVAVTALLTIQCKDAGEPDKPCPPKGLGVETESGKPCATVETSYDHDDCWDQILYYSEYACSRAQICPDVAQTKTVRNMAEIERGVAFSFVLTNCSTGSEPLRITKVQVTGDERCSFVFDTSRDLETQEIPPGKTAVLRITYRAKEPGEDHAHLRVFSNAYNFDPLILPVCGFAGAAQQIPDAGALDTQPTQRWDSGMPRNFQCKNPGDTVAPCHK